jgi:hypothetical protein
MEWKEAGSRKRGRPAYFIPEDSDTAAELFRVKNDGLTVKGRSFRKNLVQLMQVRLSLRYVLFIGCCCLLLVI